MRVSPLGVPKGMVLTVVSRDMAKTLGTKDITMKYRVVDLPGFNRISSGMLLQKAVGAISGMVKNRLTSKAKKKRIVLTFFAIISASRQTFAGRCTA